MYNDKYYYKSVPAIDSYVYRWARNDSTLKHQVEYLQEDARSFCYLYYMEVAAKFDNDDKQINNYYYRTFLLKLDGYLSSYYKNQRFTARKGKSVRMVNYTTVHADAPAYTSPEGDTCSLWEAPGRHTALTVPAHEPQAYNREAMLKAIVSLFLDMAARPDKPADMIARDRQILESAITAIISSSNSVYHMDAVAEANNVTLGVANHAWRNACDAIRIRYPELIRYITDNDETAITPKVLKKLQKYM